MPRSVRMPAALAVALLLGATPARAQSVQITPFVGYAFGGSVRSSTLDETYSFDASLAYGGSVNFSISPTWRFELLYSRQETKLGGEGLSPSFDVTIERYLAGFQEEKGEGNVRWFGTVWLGATRFVPGLGGFDSETKFGAGVGLGVKTFPEERGPALRGPRLLHSREERRRRLLRERDVPLRVLRHRPVAGRRERGADPGLLVRIIREAA